MLFNVQNENFKERLDFDSKIAVVLYGDNIDSELIAQSLEMCNEKFKLHQNVTYFYQIANTAVWKNLYQASFKKRKFEIDNKVDFDFVFAINAKKISTISNLKFNAIKCSEFSLYYFSGFFNRSSSKTSINDAGFYCKSRIFDLISNFINVKEKIEHLSMQDKSFGDSSSEHVFYYYLKTINLKTYCAETTDPKTYQFNQITE